MALNLEQKKAVVEEVSAVVRQAHSIVGAEYRGLTVSELTKLRTAARKQNVVIKVVKNSLTRLATKGTEFECMNDQLTGPLILGFSMEDPGSAGRLSRIPRRNSPNWKLNYLQLVVKFIRVPKLIGWPACRPVIRRSVCSWLS